jgi:hypothetical protein
MRRLDLGAPPRVVREIAGHSDTKVTMTIYAHVSLEEEVQGARQARRGGLADAVAVKRGANKAFALVKNWWSGTGSNCRPSAFWDEG